MPFIEVAGEDGTNMERAFAGRPEVFAAWQQLLAAVKATLDALGVQPDASYSDLPIEFRESLTVGRPIET